MTATHGQIVQAFLSIPSRTLVSTNWGCWSRQFSEPAEGYDTAFDPEWMADPWNVTDDTYINGVMMTIDFDYYMGYLIEVVERSSSIVTWVAVAKFHGPHVVTGHQQHDSMWFPNTEPQTFGSCTFGSADVCRWAVGAIYGMFDAYADSLTTASK